MQITSRLNSLEGSDDFACVCVASNFVFNWVIPIAGTCTCVGTENQA